jgi:hypothetical protein
VYTTNRSFGRRRLFVKIWDLAALTVRRRKVREPEVKPTEGLGTIQEILERSEVIVGRHQDDFRTKALCQRIVDRLEALCDLVREQVRSGLKRVTSRREFLVLRVIGLKFLEELSCSAGTRAEVDMGELAQGAPENGSTPPAGRFDPTRRAGLTPTIGESDRAFGLESPRAGNTGLFE